MLIDNIENDHDKGAGGATNLVATPAKQRNQKSCNNSGKQATIWRHARGNAKGHGQGQGHYAYGQARNTVLDEQAAAITVAK